ncbi:MAG: pyrrolo-quinoline quinone [Acidobacteriota bacterium]|nr:pyrrolo-quinoline quinone [Acidobacteriota bacterium]
MHHNESPIISAFEILPVASSFTAPAITTQPASTTVAAGQKAPFSVTAAGSTPLTYQWQRGGGAISGATASTYSTAATSSADNGAQFRVVVSNSKGSVTSNTATLTVTSTSATAPQISTQPASQQTTAGESATFTVAASGTSPLSYQWLKNGSSISGATSSAYTTPATTSADNNTQFSARVSNSAGSVTSNSATLTVISASVGVDVTTYHNDNSRTGQNLKETALTQSNVNSNTFGLRKIVTLDGKVDAQPLFLSGVPIAGQGTHNVVYAATEHDSVYALDAVTGAVLWQVSTLANGETTSDTHGCGQVSPQIGITSTPVIDRSRGPNGAIYVVAMSKNSNGSYFQRLYALDITSGAQLFGGPHTITASYPGAGDDSSGGVVMFNPGQYKERAGLLLMGGKIYTTWASHCDFRPYTGWLMSFDASTLAAVSVLNLTPNGEGGALWMSGAAPAADSSGNIYVLDGNGTLDTTLNSSGFPSKGNYGNCFCKISTSSGLKVADYFAMSNTVSESSADTDLGSGAALVLPDLSDGAGGALHLALGAGKDGNIYVVNRDNMGKFDPNANHIYLQLTGAIAGAWSMAAYYNNAIYYSASNDVLKAFTISNGKLSGSPASRAPNTLGYPGATPSISANGTSDGIVWTVGNSSPAVLNAYDAANVSRQLYNSNQATNGRDQFGGGNKYMTPTIAEGRVYIGTPSGIAIFGLLP